MKILISGASGLVGSALIPKLKESGHQILTLSRKASDNAGEVNWDPLKEIEDINKLEGVETVIHLAGESVGDSRWTEEKKHKIRDSRVIGTKILCDALLKLEEQPKTFISASAVGIYGNRDNEIITEESTHGTDFLAKVGLEWEAASNPLKGNGVRVVYTRIGIVLSKKGGALEKMLLPFKLGLGGKLGSGNQYMSWIAIDDVVNAIEFIISNDSLSEAINLTAPKPVTNKEFTKTLGEVLSRPAIIPVPAFALKIAFGEFAEIALLAGQQVIPKKLQDAGYKFLFEDIESALRHLLNQE